MPKKKELTPELVEERRLKYRAKVERSLAVRKQRYHEDPEYKRKILETRAVTYRRKHPEPFTPKGLDPVKEKARMDYYRDSGLLKKWRDKHFSNPENRQKSANYSKEWQKRNPEKCRESTRRYRLRNPPDLKRQREAMRLYRITHPDNVATALRNVHAKRIEAPGSHTPEEIMALFDKQGGKCAACKIKLNKEARPRQWHIDHVIPLTKGGSNFIDNIQILCGPCNLRKGTKHPDDWAHSLGRLFV